MLRRNSKVSAFVIRVVIHLLIAGALKKTLKIWRMGILLIIG